MTQGESQANCRGDPDSLGCAPYLVRERPSDWRQQRREQAHLRDLTRSKCAGWLPNSPAVEGGDQT